MVKEGKGRKVEGRGELRRERSGKIVHAWVIEDPKPDENRDYTSNTFTMEYQIVIGSCTSLSALYVLVCSHLSLCH